MKFIFKEATKNDIVALSQLIREVWENLEHKEWFALYDDNNYIHELLESRKGSAWKAIDPTTGHMAGLYIITYPGTDPDNLGIDIGLPEPELSRVAHMDAIVVHPLYRGQGLQQQLTLFAEQELVDNGSRYFMCTIHPDNIYSKNNMERCGYKVMKQVVKYGGLPRLILFKQRPDK